MFLTHEDYNNNILYRICDETVCWYEYFKAKRALEENDTHIAIRSAFIRDPDPPKWISINNLEDDDRDTIKGILSKYIDKEQERLLKAVRWECISEAKKLMDSAAE